MILIRLFVIALLNLAFLAGARANQAAPTMAAESEGMAGSYLAGRMASSYKDLDAATNYLKKALAYDPGNKELLSRIFVVMVGAGRIEESLEFAAQLKKEKDSDKLVRLVLACEAFRHKKYAQVLKHTNLSDKDAISDITAGLVSAWAMYGSGNAKDAVAVLDRLKGPAWYNVFRDYHAGLMGELSGDEALANERFEKAYASESKVLRVVQAYAVHQARIGARDKALEAVNKFLERVPSNSLMNRLKNDIESGRKIEPLVGNAVEGASEVMFGLGSALAQNGGDELAAIYLQLALYLSDKNALSLISLADLYDQLKQPEKVIETLARVPADSPLKPAAELQLAIALDGQEKTDEALKRLDTLLAADPKNMDALTTKGNILRVHKRFTEAQTYYDRAIALVDKPQQRHWMLYYFRGIVHERTKQWDKAETDLKQALALQPDQPSVLNYLGYSWIDQGLHLEEAMQMLKKAVQQDPNNGYVIDSVGWAYYRIGKYDDAVSWLERAIDKKPSDPVINDHLGDAYWKAGRQLEAYFQWHHAKDLKPEPEDLARIEGKLARGLTDDNQSAAPSIKAESKNN